MCSACTRVARIVCAYRDRGMATARKVFSPEMPAGHSERGEANYFVAGLCEASTFSLFPCDRLHQEREAVPL